MHEIAKLCKSLSGMLILVIVIGGIASLSTVGLMGLAAWLIASAALQPPLYTLSLAILGVRFFGIMRAILRYLERYLSHKIGFEIFNRLRTGLVSKIIEVLPFARQSDDGDSYELIVDAIDRIRDSSLRFVLPPFTASLCCWLIIVLFAYYSWWLALLTVIFWIVFMVILPYWAYRQYRSLPQEHLHLAQEVIEFYEGKLPLSIFGYTKVKLSRAHRDIVAYQQQRQRTYKLKGRIAFIVEIAVVCCFTLFLVAAMYLVLQHQLTAISAIAMLLTVQAVLEFLMAVPGLCEHVYEARLSWQRLQETIRPVKVATVVSPAAERLNLTGQLTASHLAYGYTHPLVSQMNFSLAAGSKTLLLGSSGCGKSTLFYVLTKLLPAMQGNLYWHDKAYTDLTAKYIHECMAPVFQAQHLFNGSVRENFQLIHQGITDTEITDSIERVGLTSLLADQGLDFQLVNDGSNLSGGQRHRLQLAICLARPKPLVLLDEPTAGLDIVAANKLLSGLMQAYKEQTMLVASHDLSILQYFDQVMIIDSGKLVEAGNIQELLARTDSRLHHMIKYSNVI